MTNYTPPSKWPLIRWIAFFIVFIPCWLFGLQAARGFNILVDPILGKNIATGLLAVVIYYGGSAFIFRFVGIYIIAFIEGVHKSIRNEQ